MKQISGLSLQKAQSLLKKHGLNRIKGKPLHSPLQIFIEQFKSILVFLLIIASTASFVLGETLDGFFILIILILNALLGFIQEYRAEKAIEALKQLTVSTARVLRDGRQQSIDSKLLVPGDIIFLEQGDRVPADAVLIQTRHFEVNESSLTGESMPVVKTPKDDTDSVIYLGTIVSNGRAEARVIKTGMNTRFGKIAASLTEIKKEETPLAKQLSKLGKQLGILAVAASITVFIVGIIKRHEFFEMILTSISLAVASVPEGLPAVITITLAIGMQRMAREKAILRKLSAVEALGNATIIATDKTGTLTRNQMRVVKLWFDKTSYILTDGILNKHALSFEKILTISTICNNASLSTTKQGRYTVLGDTTEGALLILAATFSVLPEDIRKKGSLKEEYSFDPTRKMMSVVWEQSQHFLGSSKGCYILSKGAPEVILKKSREYLYHGKPHPLTKQDRAKLKNAYESLAADGLRVIAFSYRDCQNSVRSRDEVEKDLIFVGFAGIADPARKEVKDAIKLAKHAGIRTVMVTGDNELTAKSIALQIGLFSKEDRIVTGKEFEKMSDQTAMSLLDKIRIFARTTPEHKLRLVRLLQKHGHTVAVTGDGVNDALALKQADIGIAMGVTGTDVAKEAADMVITDDNYATIVKAVKEGRTIYNNIKASVQYLIGCNIGEVLAVLAGMLFGWPVILTPLQILYMNLVTDGLPALALAVEPGRANIMEKKPTKMRHFFDLSDRFWFLEVSLITAGITLLAFLFGLLTSGVIVARTLAFTAIVLVQFFVFIDVWSREQSFFHTLRSFKNVMFILAFSPFFIQPLILYTPLSEVFKVTAVPFKYYLISIALSAVMLFTSEIRKFIVFHFLKNRRS